MADKAKTPEIVEESPEQVIARINSTRVPVYLDRASKNEERSQFVAVNGASFTVPKGNQQRVPWSVFEIIRRSEDAKRETERLEKELAAPLNDPALK